MPEMRRIKSDVTMFVSPWAMNGRGMRLSGAASLTVALSLTSAASLDQMGSASGLTATLEKVGPVNSAGIRPLPPLRLELALSHRPGFDFTGRSNFLDSGKHQTTEAEVTQKTLLAVAYLDFA